MKWLKVTFNKLLNKAISFGFKRTFLIHETNEGVKLVKVYGVYQDRDEAMDDMFDVAMHQKNEYELLKKYNEQS
jgi:hypothetical protein